MAQVALKRVETETLLQLSTVRHQDPLGGPSGPGTEGLHLPDHVQAILHTAKHHMLSIQPTHTHTHTHTHINQ